MNIIHLTNNLSIKKIEPNNKKDWWMIHELEKDPLVYGNNGYLWCLSSTVKDSKYRYLKRDDIYNSPFSIYHSNFPISFLEILPIYKSRIHSSVDLSYAILKKERKKGYMKAVLTNVSEYIFDDASVDEVTLMIHPSNIASQMTALCSGFEEICLPRFDENDDNYLVYRKSKNMIRK